MAEDKIQIRLFGTEEALKMLQLHAGSVRRGVRIAMNVTTLRMLRRTKMILATGKGGAPRSRRGAAGLSGSIIRLVVDRAGTITGIVGSTLPYKTGHAAILEKGGQLPAMTIRPKKGKVLAWPIGVGKFAFTQALRSGGTFNQAMKAAVKAHRRSIGGHGGGFAFARSVKIPARWQRAMPYLRPSFDEELPLIPETFKEEILAQLKKGRSGGAGT